MKISVRKSITAIAFLAVSSVVLYFCAKEPLTKIEKLVLRRHCWYNNKYWNSGGELDDIVALLSNNFIKSSRLDNVYLYDSCGTEMYNPLAVVVFERVDDLDSTHKKIKNAMYFVILRETKTLFLLLYVTSNEECEIYRIPTSKNLWKLNDLPHYVDFCYETSSGGREGWKKVK